MTGDKLKCGDFKNNNHRTNLALKTLNTLMFLTFIQTLAPRAIRLNLPIQTT
ncbi:hypothetical protein CH54_3896 [Yersinia rochesterensis]|uniref:Transposase n=1 Tax=Yersinia rochesterensis TaxID=1604335 RepID=A0ABM5STF9_9GAMM|nr:hypothetical protein DJ57_637 [Yersinia rochesterensis]AJI88552.1 hypothetical protein AW19_1889 [Yersinia frederiksenii Y225]AJJ37779.1 hypothetical protein CH54_3896 [Yersinia rochesterensis]CNG85041.1 Uncharacterised protein [Yersinia kristensenii]CRY58774.1 Uncharacterised protein [Yersinia kristensenii]